MIQPANQQNNDNGGPRPGPSPKKPPNRQTPSADFWRRNLIWIILLLVVPWGILLFRQANPGTSGSEPVSYKLFINEVKDHNVVSVTLTDSSVTGTFKDAVSSDQTTQTGTKFTTNVPSLNESTVSTLLSNGVPVTVSDQDNANSSWLTLLLQWGPLALLAVIIDCIILGCRELFCEWRSWLLADHTHA
ncbi:MAG: ATP-dependent metallopeptidase FtsH/Yme1/Tma family protein [Ktedonobacterales bacterium]